jgi:receptor protein-tyrosine kinase
LEIRRYLSIVRRRLLLVILIVAAAVGAGWLITPRDDTYTATNTLYVGSQQINLDPFSGEISQDRFAGLDRLITTFAEMVRTRPIAQDALAASGAARSIDHVVANTAAQQVPETNLIRVQYTDGDPAVAQTLTNAVATALVDQVRDFEAADGDDEAQDVVSVYEEAQLPTVANPSGLTRNLVLAGVFGLIVAGAVLALLEYLDISLRSVEDAERQLELPVLGVLPPFGNELPVTPAMSVVARPSGPNGPGPTIETRSAG